MISLVILLIVLSIMAGYGRYMEKNRDIVLKKKENSPKNGDKPVPTPSQPKEQINIESTQTKKENPPPEKKERVPFYMEPGFDSGESGTDLIDGIPW